jgi:hypothetical protein
VIKRACHFRRSHQLHIRQLAILGSVRAKNGAAIPHTRLLAPGQHASDGLSLPFQAVTSVAHSLACRPGQRTSGKLSLPFLTRLLATWAAHEQRIEPAISVGHFSCTFAGCSRQHVIEPAVSHSLACRPGQHASDKLSLPFQAVASVAHSLACHPGQQ